MADWPFRAVVEDVIGGGWGTEQPGPGSARVAIIRGTDFAAVHRGDLDTVPRRYEPTKKIERRLLAPGDIVLEISGGSASKGQSTGRSLLVTEAMLARLGEDCIPASFCRRIRVRRDLVDPAYAYYALQDMHAAGRARQYEHQSTGISNFQMESFLDLERISRPSMPEQRRIAHILGALDDKIELNRRTSEILETAARAIFTSWFIDDVPAGGTVRGLDEVAKFLNGLALQRFPPTADGSLPVIKIAQLRSGDTRDADRASVDLPADYVVRDGDVLFSWSGSLECVLWAGGKGALNQHLFKVTSADFPKWFYYLWIHQHLADFREIAAGKATTMGHIQRHHLADAKVSVPPPGVLAAADRVLGPMTEQISARKVEARTLADIRDALLPRLLMGELHAAETGRIGPRGHP